MSKAAEIRSKTRTEFTEMIVKSWTWEHLTEDERTRCMKCLNRCPLPGYDPHQMYEILHEIYFAFLSGTGYNWHGWREPQNSAASCNF